MSTAIDETGSAAAPLLLPDAPRRFGPISRRLLGRFVVAVALIEIIGTALVLSGPGAWRAAGASLVFPGAGFLYVAWPLLFLATLIALFVALVLWWGASAHLAIPVVWFGSALGAALLADGPRLLVDHGTIWEWTVPVAYAFALASATTMVVRFERSFRAKRAVVADLNTYLATARPPDAGPAHRDPDAMDVELLRWCYAIANQPDDDLVGLDWGEQFHSGTQLRYQLNALCWALSLYAANFVPNAPAQAEAALSRLILKHTDLRVWRYWRTLNLLGNFDADPDPIARDNIMFSAFLGDVINIYEAATGSTRFDEPGSLTFVWKDGRTFPYDHHSIAAAVEENYRRSSLGFYACEPGWSFTVCNVMGAQSLFGHDRLHGTDAWERVKPAWVNALDAEYLTPDGSYAHIKSDIVGLAWDTGEVPGGHYLAAGSNRFADILPRHAQRAAALERRRAGKKIGAVASMVTDGHLELELPETLERNRTISSALTAWTTLIGGARLLGEHDLAEAAIAASARQCATGERWPGRPLASGVPGLGSHMILRWSVPLGTADLNVRGYTPPVGPVLLDAAWGEVLVTEARSPDGRSLVVRLEPLGDEPVGRTTVRFGSLVPGDGYQLEGSHNRRLDADHDGTASAVIELTGPKRIVLTPLGESA